MASTNRSSWPSIYAQALEAQGFTVDRAGLAIGERPARMTAFGSGQINLMPEYVGFGLEFFTQDPEASAEIAAVATSGDAATDAQSLQTVLGLAGIDATVLAPSAGQDTNAAVVRPDTAEQLGLAKMSDLAARAGRAALRPAARLRDEPALPRRPRGELRHRLAARPARAAASLWR